jgi:COP9 signalosome complex subunit 7
LLDLPNVAALRSSALEDEQRIFALLELFAFETFSQYQANKSAFGALLPVQERKLRQLSIVSLSARQKHISYSDLQEELGIFDMRELEDLLLDTMYQGLIEGKLDAKNELLRVDFAISRDVRDKDLADVVRVLEAWTVRSTNLLKEIGDRVNSARGALEQDAIDRRQFEDRVKETKEKLSKIFAKAGPGAGQADKGEARLGQGEIERRKLFCFCLFVCFFFFF